MEHFQRITRTDFKKAFPLTYGWWIRQTQADSCFVDDVKRIEVWKNVPHDYPPLFSFHNQSQSQKIRREIEKYPIISIIHLEMKNQYLCRVGSTPISQKRTWPSGALWYPQGQGKPWSNISFKYLSFLVFLDSGGHEKVMFSTCVYRDETNPNPISWGLNGTQSFPPYPQKSSKQFDLLKNTMLTSNNPDFMMITLYPKELRKICFDRFIFIPTILLGLNLTFLLSSACVESLPLEHSKDDNTVFYDRKEIGIYSNSPGSIVSRDNPNILEFMHTINQWYKHQFYDQLYTPETIDKLTKDFEQIRKQLKESQRSLQNQKMKDLRQFSVEHFRKLENRIKILQQKIKCRIPNETSKLFSVDKKGQFIA